MQVTGQEAGKLRLWVTLVRKGQNWVKRCVLIGTERSKRKAGHRSRQVIGQAGQRLRVRKRDRGVTSGQYW